MKQIKRPPITERRYFQKIEMKIIICMGQHPIIEVSINDWQEAIKNDN